MSENEQNVSVIDRVVRAYNNRRKRVVIPEFDDLELFFGVFTPADSDGVDQRMRELHGDDRSQWPRQAHRALTLIEKAELEDGTRAFNYGDLHAILTRVPIAVLSRLMVEVYSVGVTTTEAAEKKSETTAASEESTNS